MLTNLASKRKYLEPTVIFMLDLLYAFTKWTHDLCDHGEIDG